MRLGDFSNNFHAHKEVVILTRPKEKFESKFRLVTQDPEFQKDIDFVRKKWKVDLENPRLIQRDKNDLKLLLKKHNLSKDWDYILSIYITTGQFESMGDPHGIELDFDKNNKFVRMKIYPETTLKEIKLAYKTILHKFKKGKAVKTRQAKNSDRDTLIFELRKKGKSYKEIISIVKDNYAEDVDSGHISRLLEKMKKRRRSL